MHIFLSPHFDDAALSCGGLIARLGAAHQAVEVETIFGGKPDYTALSPFARMIHGRPLAGEDPIEQRRAEERRALAILGVTGRLGDYLDCIYRQDAEQVRWLYAAEDALFGPVDPADDDLVEELAHCLAALAPPAGRCTLYAPLAIGNHVDHQIVRHSAARLQEHGHDVRYYEDYPYIARDPAGLEASLGRWAPVERWQAEIVALSPADLQRKVEAIVAYASQLGVLFPGEGEANLRVAAAIQVQVGQTGQTGPAERLWRARR
jgi:LmbE family N-acetylglucosaminyl deacetylase